MQIQTLSNSHWHLEILPDMGASILNLRAASGRPVMRPVRLEDVKTSSQCASFALMPFSNRIRAAAFDFGGEHVQLKATTADGLTQHGDVRNRPWKLAASDATSLTFSFDSADFADINWPWPFTAQIRYELSGADFITHLTLTNAATRPMPAGMGLHPYFDVEGDPTLQLKAEGWYQNDELSLPTGAALPLLQRADFSTPRSIAGLGLDDVLQGWQGAARLQWPKRMLSMQASREFGHVVLFSAPDGSFAIEPVSHATDAVNLVNKGVTNTGLQVLQSGESLTGTVTLTLGGDW